MFQRLSIIALSFLLLFLGTSWADSTGWIKTTTVENDTAGEVTSYVSTSTLVPNQTRIWEINVFSTRSNSYSPYVSLWDESLGTAHSTSNLIGESEASANTSQRKPFIYPRNISTQVKVVLGPYSAVTIEYTR